MLESPSNRQYRIRFQTVFSGTNRAGLLGAALVTEGRLAHLMAFPV